MDGEKDRKRAESRGKAFRAAAAAWWGSLAGRVDYEIFRDLGGPYFSAGKPEPAEDKPAT